MSTTNLPSLLDINDRVYYLNARVSLLHEIFFLLINNPDDADFPPSAWRGLHLLARSMLEDTEFLENWTAGLLESERQALG